MSHVTSEIIGKEIHKITSINRSTNDEIGMILHTPDFDIRITMPISIDTMEDYVNNIGSFKVFEFMIGTGDYNDFIKPKSKNLEVTLGYYRDGVLSDKDIYKAVILNIDTPESDIKSNIDSEILNKSMVTVVSMQLIEREIEVLRAVKIEGIWKNITMYDFLSASFYKAIDKNTLNGNKVEVKLNLIKPDNKAINKHVIIPTGMSIIDLPSFLQDTNYGVYNGDIGIFFKKYFDGEKKILNLFIYPLYTVIDKPLKTLHIYHTGSKIVDKLDNTWMLEGDVLKIISSSNVEVIEAEENLDMDTGNALTFTNPYAATDYTSKVTNDAITYNKNKTMFSNDSYKREDGMTKENYIGNCNNVFKYRSSVNFNSLNTVKVTWSYSYPSLLLPGMVVRFYFQKGNEIMEMIGTLISVYTAFDASVKKTNSMLIMKLKRVVKE